MSLQPLFLFRFSSTSRLCLRLSASLTIRLSYLLLALLRLNCPHEDGPKEDGPVGGKLRLALSESCFEDKLLISCSPLERQGSSWFIEQEEHSVLDGKAALDACV